MKNSKKILFIDEANFQTEMRSQLLQNQHDVDVVNSYDEVVQLFSKDKYDVVIIDFSRDFGLKALQHIDGIDPMQDMITISMNEDYSEQQGCDYCVSHHKRRRLVPPFPFPQLLRLVNSFDLTICPVKNSFSV